MAKKQIHFRRYISQMKFLAGNIIEEQIPIQTKELQILRNKMRMRVQQQSSYSTGEMTNDKNLVISAPRKGRYGFVIDLKAISPYAKIQEFGITPMWVDANKYPKLMNWVNAVQYEPRYGTGGKQWVYIGGSDGNIEKNNSKNKFFFNTVNDYVTSKRLEKEIAKGVIKAIKKTW